MIKNCTQEVSWPPSDEKNIYVKALPDQREKGHLGRNRRQKMDLELKNFQGSTAHYYSKPFSKGKKP